MPDKYFTFIDRTLRLQFFELEPVAVNLCICGENDRLMDALNETIRDHADDYDALYASLERITGEETAAALMARAGEQDIYAVTQLLLYLHREYLEGRSKNLLAAARGRSAGTPEQAAVTPRGIPLGSQA